MDRSSLVLRLLRLAAFSNLVLAHEESSGESRGESTTYPIGDDSTDQRENRLALGLGLGGGVIVVCVGIAIAKTLRDVHSPPSASELEHAVSNALSVPPGSVSVTIESPRHHTGVFFVQVRVGGKSRASSVANSIKDPSFLATVQHHTGTKYVFEHGYCDKRQSGNDKEKWATGE